MAFFQSQLSFRICLHRNDNGRRELFRMRHKLVHAPQLQAKIRYLKVPSSYFKWLLPLLVDRDFHIAHRCKCKSWGEFASKTCAKLEFGSSNYIYRSIPATKLAESGLSHCHLFRQKSVNLRTLRSASIIRAQLSSEFTIALRCLQKKSV